MSRLCKHCSRVAIVGRFCDVHAALHVPRQDNQRWRSRKGRRWRKAYLADHPYCADCTKANRPVPATEVHHLIEQMVAPDLIFERSNVVSLCVVCHLMRHGKGGDQVEVELEARGHEQFTH